MYPSFLLFILFSRVLSSDVDSISELLTEWLHISDRGLELVSLRKIGTFQAISV